jgi:hypothetical protein
MLGVVRRMLRKQPPSYASRVAAVLLHQGFDPKALDEMEALGCFSQDSDIFRMLAQRDMNPAQAALAIRLATQRYQRTRLIAKADGWRNVRPVKIPRDYPPHEAYFVNLLQEAAESARIFPG